MTSLDRAAGLAVETGKKRMRTYSAPKLREFGRLHLQTQGQLGSATDGNSGMAKPGMASDRLVKANIVRIGSHPAGFGLYLFDYKPEFQETWGKGRRWGVMADEVAAIVPEAVHVGDDGYQRVDYSMLGMEPKFH